ncbi:glycosyltransferase [Halomonas coralii]|uniref:glycosyltransferase n=1 Tax=Modicisalibacter sp. R2A 31.J TaxID=2831898 RepID=UPI001CCF232E|nr:glycosyltransferase [Modicisalibacter sp. R2A 31.J]MBZ9557582.1 glycosyltransferase [Modicisalibacter sp. R2A 31.J]
MNAPALPKRRILIVVRRLNMGGIQKAALSLARGLLQEGHDVHLLVLKGRPELTPPAGTQVHLVDFERQARQTPTGLAYHLLARLVLKPALPGTGFIWPGWSVSRRFKRHVQTLETRHGAFDLILIRGQGAFELLWNYRDPRCWQVVEGPVGGPGNHRLARWLYRKLYENKRVIAVSRGIADLLAKRLERHHVRPQRVTVIPNAVPLQSLAALSEETPATPLPTTPYFVHVGRLSSVKNQALLLQAFARADLPVELVIIGDGDKRQSLEQLARELGVAERVHFLGQQTNPYPWMANARAFVLSSKVEGLGLVLIESLALGTQCVVTDAPGGIREVLPAAQTRLIARPSVESLADKMREALEHPVTVDPEWAARFDERGIAQDFLALLSS